MKKKALVTGGTHGIGLAIARKLAQSGNDVIVCSRTRERVDAAVDELRKYNTTVEGYIFDAIDLNDIDHLISDIYQKHEVDILINNVGGGGRWGKEDVLETDFRVWEEVYNKNMNVTVKFMLASLPAMVKHEWGRIITISSIYGQQAGGRPWYVVAKAAQIALMKSMSVKPEFVSKGITFNTVIPGAIFIENTGWDDLKKLDPEVFDKRIADTYPMGHMGKPEDVAEIVAFLCSEEASYMNGASITVDGGESVAI